MLITIVNQKKKKDVNWKNNKDGYLSSLRGRKVNGRDRITISKIQYIVKI